MGGPVRGRLLIWGDAMCLRARIRSFKPPQLHFLPFYHNLEVDKDCLVTQFCLFCIVTSLKILASYTLLPLLMYSCKFQLRNSIFIILYTITCALNDQSCRCAIKQHSFIHSFLEKPCVRSRDHIFSPLVINLVRIFALIKSRTSVELGHVGLKIRSLGEILENPCVRSRDHIFSPILVKFGKNVCLDKSQTSPKLGHVGLKN